MHPAGYHLAQSLHAFLPQRAQRDALARTGRQARRRGEGQPAPARHAPRTFSVSSLTEGEQTQARPHSHRRIGGSRTRRCRAALALADNSTPGHFTYVDPGSAQSGATRSITRPTTCPAASRRPPPLGRLRHRGVPDSLPSRQAGERGPGLHHTLALRLRHPVRPRSRPHPDHCQRRWNPPTTASPGTRRASRGRTARLRRADDHSLIRAWARSHVRAEAATVPQLYIVTYRLREDLGGRASAPFGAAGRGLLAGLLCRTRCRCGFADEVVRRP
jgi:hypothetical protein